MENNDEFWRQYKSNYLLYRFIIFGWFFRNKSEGIKIFERGGKLHAYKDGVAINRLLVYYEGLERYEKCYLLKCVLDGLNEASV